MDVIRQPSVLTQPETTQSVKNASTLTHRVISFSDNYCEARDTVLPTGLPFFYVEKPIGPEKFLRTPVSDYFSASFRGGPTSAHCAAEVESNSELLNKTYQVFFEAKTFREPVLVCEIRQLAGLNPGTDIFLDTVIHWPKIITQEKQDENIVYTAALFQSGYFLSKQPEYARFLLADIFPKYAKSSLAQVFADSLSIAVLDPIHFSIVRALLDLGADPDRPSYEGVSPLNESLLRTNIESAKLLLNRGAHIRRDAALESPLEILTEEYDPIEHRDLYEAFEQASKRAPSRK